MEIKQLQDVRHGESVIAVLWWGRLNDRLELLDKQKLIVIMRNFGTKL